jgi:hypothetical protein
MIKLALCRDLQARDDLEPSKEVYRQRQVDELLKKFASPEVDQQPLEELTYGKFHIVNEHMGRFNSNISILPTRRITSSMSYAEKTLRRARALMYDVVGQLDIDTWFSACKHSQGSSIGVPFVDTSLEKKWLYPLSVTEEARPLFDSYLRFDSQMNRAVENFNSHHLVSERYQIVRGSRATTVEKNSSIRRMIAIEPTCNMFLQQGLMNVLYERMKRVGLNVETLPDLHKMLARESAITSRNATIDFSSASDCVSIELLRWLLPPKWFRAIYAVRSPEMQINADWHQLNMISTMGNAVTFPLETLVFWTLAHAVRLSEMRTNTLFPEWEDLKCCSVFGDDCIVPTDIAAPFMEFATSLGFIVNDEKSYYGSECFRESCGGDYYSGYNVRPVFVRAPTSARISALEPWLYTIMNALIKKYIVYFGELSYVYEKDIFLLFSKLFAEYDLRLKIVPSFYPEDSGLQISFDMKRFLSCYKFACEPISRSHQGTYTFRYLRFQYPKRGHLVSDDIRYCTKLKTFVNNEITPPLSRDFNFPTLGREQMRFVRRRLGGGYVVARGLTSHWDIV